MAWYPVDEEMNFGDQGLNVSKTIADRLMIVVRLFHQYYDMAFLQIPHSALPEKNSKDPPPVRILVSH